MDSCVFSDVDESTSPTTISHYAWDYEKLGLGLLFTFGR